MAVALTALGAVAAASLAGARLPWAVPALALSTLAVWLVRVPLLLAADHEPAFVVVHLVLAGVSAGLAAAVLRTARPSSVDPVSRTSVP